MTEKTKRSILFALIVADIVVSYNYIVWTGALRFTAHGVDSSASILFTLFVYSPFLWWFFAVRASKRSQNSLASPQKRRSVRPGVVWSCRIGLFFAFAIRLGLCTYYDFTRYGTGYRYGAGGLAAGSLMEANMKLFLTVAFLTLYAYFLLLRPYRKWLRE